MKILLTLNIIVLLAAILLMIRTTFLLQKVRKASAALTIKQDVAIKSISDQISKAIISTLFILNSGNDEAKKKLLSIIGVNKDDKI